MPRPPLSCPPPESLPGKPTRFNTKFRITTFRMCGGVEPGLPDPVTPIRVPALRGQLRFWWRAVFASRFPDAAALKTAEDRLWGCTEAASALRFYVHSCIELRELTRPASRPGDRRTIPEEPSFALFPAQQDPKKIGKLSNPGTEFELEVAFKNEDAKNQVIPALFATANFGGYGARSRRGCGAFFNPHFVGDLVNQPVEVALQYLQKSFQLSGSQNQTPNQARDWPSLKLASIILGPKILGVQEAWQEAIKLYRLFRQDRPPGQSGRPGRSRWPEPDSIRLERGTHAPQHPPRIVTRDFPRAILGLPIIFHFKDYGEPADQSLEPNDPSGTGGRLASPIIIKPFMVSPTHAYPMILRLHSNLLTPTPSSAIGSTPCV